MIKINWVRIKESLHLMAENSGASVEYAMGNIIGIVSVLQSIGIDFRDAWPEIVKNMPDNLRVQAVPTPFLSLENVWTIDFVHVEPFHKLLEAIPEDMRKMPSQYHQGWTCRDDLLDKYLHICSIFQRETDREFAIWNSDMNGEPAYRPKLKYELLQFRQAGSQYIAEWAINDLRKEYKERYNWHMQNTSRWLYAGGLLVQDGRVSIHT
jgi:hypothetical protein